VTTVLSPSPKQKFFDNNGNPLAGGKLFVYVALTSTKATTYTSSTGLSANTNPIILDYRGECNLWLQPNVPYKYVLAPANDTDPPTNPIYTVDQIISNQLLTLYGGSDGGTVNAYSLNFVANFTAYADGIVIYWIPGNSNTAASTINVNGLGAVNILNQGAQALIAGDIVAGQVAPIMYIGGSFYLIAPVAFRGTFTGTLTGVVGTVTNTCGYARTGNIATLYLPYTTGTSNSIFFGMSGLPASITPARSQFCGGYGAVDNGINIGGGTDTVQIQVTTSGTLVFYKNRGVWTGAAAKAIGWSDFTSSVQVITYMLS
jgi:hypothetical protein